MQTITFYSYKGGVGRTLAVANVAKYLSRFGLKVFAIDFDLEAPGLHYKLVLGQTAAPLTIEKGVVDYIHSVVTELKPPSPVSDFVLKVEEREESGGTIHLMPAGRVLSAEYWRRLARISWHELFYAEGAKGVPLFLDLKARIEREYHPDVVLIDARTGITEMGGVATTILADKVVCLLMHNIENLEGAREVLRSIIRTPRLQGQKPVEVIPVLTRIPKVPRSDTDERVLASTLKFLNEQAENVSDTLSLPEAFVFHSEPELEVTEELRIGGGKTFEESLLLRDYLRLFARLVPREVVEPQLGRLVSEAVERALDDPEGTQRELEALSASYPHAETYRALLKFHRLRRAEDSLILTTASRLWELSGKADDPLLWEVARAHFKRADPVERPGYRAEFLEAAWRSGGAEDNAFAVRLADAYSVMGEPRRGIEVLRTAVEGKPDVGVVVAYVRWLSRLENWPLAFGLIEKFRGQFEEASEFISAWAGLIVRKRDLLEATKFVEDGDTRLGKLRQEQPALAIRLLNLVGRPELAESLLMGLLNRALAQGPGGDLLEVRALFEGLERQHEFETKVAQTLGPRGVEFLRETSEEERLRRFRGRRPRLEP